MRYFAKSIHKVKGVRNSSSQLGRDCKIGCGDRRRIGCDDALDAKAQLDHQEGSTKPHNSFHDKIGGKKTKSVSALNVTAPASQWNIESCADSQKGDKGRTLSLIHISEPTRQAE